MLTWKRQRDETGTFYQGEDPRKRDEAFVVTNYGGEWLAEREIVSGQAWVYSAETLKEAKLACEVMAHGGDPRGHRTRAKSYRRGVGNTTMWKYNSRWSCSCGATQSGSSSSAKECREAARTHRMAEMRAFVEAVV